MTDSEQPRAKPTSTHDDAVAIVRRLREHGHVAWLAGGCVRDMLLGLDPKDYDVATDATPPQVRKLFTSTQAVGAAFGVILVRHGKSVVEVATFRSEERYEDGRRPTAVHFTTADQDAQRRDFTINGLFFDPIENKVIDYVGGQQDLQTRTLRAIGDPDQRFNEDHLRLLRAVRFAARFDLEIEPRTARAIKTHAPRLRRISPERIAEELRLMLTPPTRTRAWKLLWEFELVAVVFPQLPRQETIVEERSIFLALSPGTTIPFSLALAGAALCYRTQDDAADVRASLTPQEISRSVRAVRHALRISNEETEQLREMLTSLKVLLDEAPPSVARLKRFLATATSGGVRAILDAIALTHRHTERINALREQLGKLESTDFAPPPLITGDDLIAAGLTPGPLFKRVLDNVYDAQLEGVVRTKEEALTRALTLARQ